MYCTSCGAQIQEGVRFCTGCGAPVDADAPVPVQQQVWVAQSQSPSPLPSPVRGDGSGIVYAGFMRRFAALFVDGLILAAPMIGLWFLTALMLAVVFTAVDSQPSQALSQCAGFVLAIAVKFIYFTLQESSKHQATFGKRALGIKVTDERGQRLSFGRAAARYFASALSYVTLYVGFLMAGFTDRKRALHDVLTGTLVVDRWAYTDHPERQQYQASGCLIAIVIAALAVCLVIPILAAIAIPAYQDYVIRSQVSEGVALAEGSKTAVAEFYSNKGYFPPSNESAGVAEPSSITGNYVTSLQVDNGTIHVTYGNQANRIIAGKVLGFVPTGRQGDTIWTCGAEAGTTIDTRYLPSACRESSQTQAQSSAPPSGGAPAEQGADHPAPPPAAAEAPPVQVSVIELADAYGSNEVTADQKYKGKQLLVTGVVDSVSKSELFENSINAQLNEGGDLPTKDVLADHISESDAVKLSKGMRVTFLCTGNGNPTGLMPDLDNCVLQQ